MRFTEVTAQYNHRMSFVERNAVPSLEPTFARVITQVTREFYWNMYVMVRDNKVNYLDWLTYMREFFLHESVLAMDPDDKLREIGERVLNHKDILEYYHSEVCKNHAAFDMEQILIQIKMMDRVLAMDV